MTDRFHFHSLGGHVWVEESAHLDLCGGASPRGMSLRMIVVAALALSAIACNPRGGAVSQQSPKIRFDETTHSFGPTEQGTTVRHVFTFRNVGGMDLTIDNVRAACGCVATVSASRIIPPHAAGRIETSFDTADEAGPQTRTITVYSNDPSQPVTTLTLNGAVHAQIAADPPQLYVGHVARGQAASNELHIVGTVATATVETHGRVLDAARIADATHVRVMIRKDAPSGPFTESVYLHSAAAPEAVLTVPVAGVVDADAPQEPEP